jgi:hypothetical protein
MRLTIYTVLPWHGKLPKRRSVLHKLVSGPFIRGEGFADPEGIGLCRSQLVLRWACQMRQTYRAVYLGRLRVDAFLGLSDRIGSALGVCTALIER